MFLKWELYSYFLLLPVEAENDGKIRTPPLHAYCLLCMHNLLCKAGTPVNSKTLPRQMESTVQWVPEEYIVRLHSSFPAEHYHCLLSIPYIFHRKESADINNKWDFCHPFPTLASLPAKQGICIENTYKMVTDTLHLISAIW